VESVVVLTVPVPVLIEYQQETGSSDDIQRRLWRLDTAPMSSRVEPAATATNNSLFELDPECYRTEKLFTGCAADDAIARRPWSVRYSDGSMRRDVSHTGEFMRFLVRESRPLPPCMNERIHFVLDLFRTIALLASAVVRESQPL
jgi:hypothetical protein